MKYLNRTYLAWRSKLKGTRKTMWYEVLGMNIREVGVKIIYPENIGGFKEEKYIEASRY